MNAMNLKNISYREKIIGAVAAAFIIVTILWLGVYEPAVERSETMTLKLEAKERELTEVKGLSKRYMEVRSRLNVFENKLKTQTKGFSSLAVMESLAKNAGVQNNVSYMAPRSPVALEGYRELPVELRLKQISLGKLISFLKAAKASGNYLRVKRIAVKPQYENQELLDVSISIAGYEKAGPQ